MRTWTRILMIVMPFSLLLAACSVVAPPPPRIAAPHPETILFVGNSFTGWNMDLSEHMALMAAHTDPPLSVESKSVLIGGATLRTHWDAGTALEEIQDGAWEAVVLQDDIPEIREHDLEQFYEYVRLFDQEVENAGGQSVLFMAWGYPRLDWIDTEEISEAHRIAAEQTGAKTAPIGAAWLLAMQERPDLILYDRDNEHPSIAGSFLALNVLYATLFERTPVGHPYRLADIFPDPATIDNEWNQRTAKRYRDQYALAEEDAEFLQRIAWETVQEWQEGFRP